MDKLELDKTDIDMMSEAMSMYLTLAGIEVSRHKMYKDTSMERLFNKMEVYARAGVLWAKLAQAKGISQEDIAEFLGGLDDD